jgi:hypothetical protein
VALEKLHLRRQRLAVPVLFVALAHGDSYSTSLGFCNLLHVPYVKGDNSAVLGFSNLVAVN